jgi:hypothetical protein
MNPRRDSWTIVLSGSWNARIFSAPWIAANIFRNDELEFEIPNQPGLPYRYTWGNVRITPGSNQIVLLALDTTDEALRSCEEYAVRILELLPHTPLSAVGTNLGFVEDTPSADVLRVFTTGDMGEIAVAGYEVAATELLRRLRYENGKQLNFKLSLREGRVLVDLNFHRPVQSGAAAVEALRGAFVLDRDRATTLLDVYNFDLAAEIADA